MPSLEVSRCAWVTASAQHPDRGDENDSVYALDANSPPRARGNERVLWHEASSTRRTALRRPVPGRRDRRHPAGVGITGTPVISDPQHALRRQQGEVQPTGSGGPHYVTKFHALDLTNGRENHGSPVSDRRHDAHPDGSFTNKTPISVPGTGAGSANGVIAFNAAAGEQPARPGCSNQGAGAPDGVVFAGFGSQGDFDSYTAGSSLRCQDVGRSSRSSTRTRTATSAGMAGGSGPSVASNGDLILSTGNG